MIPRKTHVLILGNKGVETQGPTVCFRTTMASEVPAPPSKRLIIMKILPHQMAEDPVVF